MLPRTLLVTGAAFALAACASLQPQITAVHASRGEPGADRRAIGARGQVPADTALAVPEPRGTGDVADGFPTANDEVRRVCRTAGWPRGWIPTAYVEAPGECPERSGVDAAYNAAVIVRFDRRPRGSVLEVCADQVVPAGWVNDGDGSPETAARCPGAGKDGAGRSMRLRRVAINERM